RAEKSKIPAIFANKPDSAEKPHGHEDEQEEEHLPTQPEIEKRSKRISPTPPNSDPRAYHLRDRQSVNISLAKLPGTRHPAPMRTARLLGEGRSFYHVVSRVVDRRRV